MKKKEIYNILIKLLKRHNVSKIAVFGSYARNEESAESDVDIIVNFTNRKTLLDLVEIESELEEAIGKKVDLLTEHSINPNRKKYIEQDLKVIYS